MAHLDEAGDIREYARKGVRAFPDILARASLEIYLRPNQPMPSKPKRKK
jgi:hypothetical protein